MLPLSSRIIDLSSPRLASVFRATLLNEYYYYFYSYFYSDYFYCYYYCCYYYYCYILLLGP